MLGRRESPKRLAASGSGVPRLGVPCSIAATPDQPGLGYPRLCCCIFHKVCGGFGFIALRGGRFGPLRSFARCITNFHPILTQ